MTEYTNQNQADHTSDTSDTSDTGNAGDTDQAAEEAELVITHSHAEGTLIAGTSRGDGSAAALKDCGWRWGRSIASWYLPHSRDRLAKRWRIDQTVAQLRAAGFSVSVDIDDTPRPTGDVEADQAARQADRIEALTAKAERRHHRAEAAQAASDRASDALPPWGEPIKVGHHSETRHRNALDRAHRKISQAVEAADAAREADRRREAAEHTTDGRYSQSSVGNRIDHLAADLRRLERAHLHAIGRARLAGEDPAAVPTDPALDQTRDQLAYWTSQRDQAVAAGVFTDYSPRTVNPGDAVKVRGHWHRVERANTKTVRVAGEFGPRTTPWHEVTDHRSLAQLAEAAAMQQAHDV